MPNWYGIEGIKYEWRGPWEGPILHHKGLLCNADGLVTTCGKN